MNIKNIIKNGDEYKENKGKKKDVMKNVKITADIYEKLNYFFLVIKEKDGKKSVKPPEKWTESKKENPTMNEYGFNNGVGLIMGQKIEDNKYIIGVDFDNKDTKDNDDNIIVENGTTIRKKLYKNIYQTNKYK